MKENIIQYGFGLDYLEHWEISHGLREVFQNYLDFGHYDIQTIEEKGTDNLIVSISNTYKPTDLEFLRIGNSGKRKDNTTIGKYGEGLKMAFLVFQREGLKIKLRTQTHEFTPCTYINELGECFGIDYKELEITSSKFTIMFTLPKTYYDSFITNIIKDTDIIYKDKKYGSIVSKPKGNIYVGNLFVTTLPNFSKAYNFNPEHIPLDRDRAMPSSFDIKWNAAKINESYGNWTISDVKYHDMEYVSKIPERLVSSFTPVTVGNSVHFTAKDIDEKGDVVDVVIKEGNLKQSLTNHSFFEKVLIKLRTKLLKGLGVYALLLEFQNKHNMYGKMQTDFELIIEKAKGK